MLEMGSESKQFVSSSWNGLIMNGLFILKVWDFIILN